MSYGAGGFIRVSKHVRVEWKDSEDGVERKLENKNVGTLVGLWVVRPIEKSFNFRTRTDSQFSLELLDIEAWTHATLRPEVSSGNDRERESGPGHDSGQAIPSHSPMGKNPFRVGRRKSLVAFLFHATHCSPYTHKSVDVSTSFSQNRDRSKRR